MFPACNSDSEHMLTSQTLNFPVTREILLKNHYLVSQYSSPDARAHSRDSFTSSMQLAKNQYALSSPYNLSKDLVC